MNVATLKHLSKNELIRVASLAVVEAFDCREARRVLLLRWWGALAGTAACAFTLGVGIAWLALR